MSITIKDIGSLIIYLGALAAAVAAIAVVARYAIVNPLKTWLREQIKAPLDGVSAEMAPNHGSTLRDAVNRIETRQDELSARFRDHLINHPGPGGHPS